MSLTCPKCQGEMRTYERNGVTVDQCADCRGLFLDRGELERLVDAESAWSGAAAGTGSASAPAPAAPTYQPPQAHGYPPQHGQQQYSYGGKPYPRKKKSFLSELFDD